MKPPKGRVCRQKLTTIVGRHSLPEKPEGFLGRLVEEAATNDHAAYHLG